MIVRSLPGHKDLVCGVNRVVRVDDRSDAELLRSARADAAAFGLFYDRYEAAVATLNLSRLGIRDLDYCHRYPGDQSVDPGNDLIVSPIEATARAAIATPR